MNTLGEKLKKLRKDKRWTIKEVAKKLGLQTYSTYSNWEYDLREPDLETVAKIAEIYDIDPGFLVPQLSKSSNADYVEQMSSYVNIAKVHPDIELVTEQTRLLKFDHENEAVYQLVKNSNETDEELAKTIKLNYKGTLLSEEKAKQVFAFIRFLAESD